MDRYSRLKQALAASMPDKLAVTQATVKEVSGLTCTVTVNGLDITGVRMKATTADSGGKLLVTPKEGSTVLIGSLSGDLKDLAVLSVDEAEKVEISGEIIFNGGENDGLVLVKELTGKLNAIERDLNALKQAFSTWVSVPNDGGAALKAAATAWYGQQLAETGQAEIENPKIKQ
jgi:hypothetical protein